MNYDIPYVVFDAAVTRRRSSINAFIIKLALKFVFKVPALVERFVKENTVVPRQVCKQKNTAVKC